MDTIHIRYVRMGWEWGGGQYSLRWYMFALTYFAIVCM